MQKNAKERAIFLRDNYGWNVIPLKYFKRNYTTGKKVNPLGVDWQPYQKQVFNIDKYWDVNNHKAIAIMTGITSNITIIDIDSHDKAAAYEKALGRSLSEMCNYVVKTFKGYQLFYSYNKNLTTKIMGAEKTDILSGSLTFADPFNDSYEIFYTNNKPLEPIPEDLLNILLEKLEARQDNNFDDALSQAIRDESDVEYRYPMFYTIKEFLGAKIIGKNLNEQLKNIFYSKDWSHLKNSKKHDKFSNCSIEGERHNQLVYFGSLLAKSPTISKDIYTKTFRKIHIEIFKLDIDNDTHEANLYKNRVKGNMKYWRYDEEWEQKHNDIQDATHKNFIDRYEIEYWIDSSGTKKYKVYDAFEKMPVESRNINDLRNDVIRLINKYRGESAELTTDEIKEIKGIITEDKIIERRSVFEVNEPRRFFTNLDGNRRYNLFNRTGYLLDILEDNSHLDVEIPPTIKIILDNVFPVKEEQDRFLHDLAYHMTHLHTTTVAYVIMGVPGTGKNRITDSLIAPIYGKHYYKGVANEYTSRFRSQFENKLAINLDEIKNQLPYNGGELGSFYNTLKSTLGNDTISVEGKGVTVTTCNNKAFYILTSNDKKPFVIEDATDRRFNFIHTTDIPLDTIKGYPKSIEQAKQLIASELPEFVQYLSNIKLCDKKNREIIKNKARDIIFKGSETGSFNILKAIKSHTPDDCENINVSNLLKEMYHENKTYVVSGDLKEAAGDDYKHLRGLLRDNGFEEKTIRNGTIVNRCWVINPRLEKMISIVDDFENIEDVKEFDLFEDDILN